MAIQFNNKNNTIAGVNVIPSYITDSKGFTATKLGNEQASSNVKIGNAKDGFSFMPIVQMAAAIGGDVAGMIQKIRGKDVKEQADLMMEKASAGQMSAQTNGDTFDTLMSDWANNSNIDYVTKDNFGYKDFGEGLVENLASGNVLTSIFGNIGRNAKIKKQTARVNEAIDYANQYNLAQLNNRADNLMRQQNSLLSANYAAFGGPLNMLSHGGKIYIKPENRGKFTETKKRTGKTTEELTHSKNPLTRKRAIFAQNSKKWKHAFGGELGTNGMDWTNGLMSIDAGGLHEENPYEGVVMGMDEEGTPNLVEEGETIFNDYVYSRRLKVPKAIRKKYKLKDDITFADASKQLAKESEERPNDPISQKALKVAMADLAYAQEEINSKGSKGNKFAKGGMTLSDLRYVPAIGSAFGAIKSILDEPDYEMANALIKEGKGITAPRVGFTPIGTYIDENPMDRMFAINQLNAQSGATRRNIMNMSGLNRGTAMAGLLAANNSFLNNIGALNRQAAEYNYANRLQARTFNRATNQYNSEAGLKASIANAESAVKAKSLGLEAISKGYQLRQAARDTRDAAISANLTNLFDNTGNIGWEEYQRRAIESSPALLGWYLERSGKLGYNSRTKSKGGFLTIKKK